MTLIERRVRDSALPPLRWHDTVVVGIRQLTPRMVRVTLAADSIRSFEPTGPDDHLKLVLPRGGGRLPDFDVTGNLYAQWRGVPAEVRPHLRTYTVRTLRRAAGELDIDFALHAAGTPAMRWLAALGTGDPCAVYGSRSEFDPPADARQVLLFADEAGTPALAAILDALPAGVRAQAIIACEDADDLQLLGHGPRAEVEWVHRTGAPTGTARELLGGLGRLRHPAEPWYAWAGCATEALPSLRAALRRLPGYRRERVELVGYWRADGVGDPS